MASGCSRDPDKLFTSSNVSYNIVRRSSEREEAVEGDYETPDQKFPPPSSSSHDHPHTAASATGDLYESV